MGFEDMSSPPEKSKENEEKEKFREEFLKQETEYIEDIIKKVSESSFEKEVKTKQIEDLEELRKRMEEQIANTIGGLKVYSSDERKNRMESYLRELGEIENLDPTLKKMYKEQPEVKQHMKDINLEMRIMQAIEDGKL